MNKILNKEQEIHKAKEISILRKLIPNTDSKILVYLLIISIVGTKQFYLLKQNIKIITAFLTVYCFNKKLKNNISLI